MSAKVISLFTYSLLVVACMGNPVVKRQGAGNGVRVVDIPPRDLLPPPALSASFPTLRPNPGKNVPQQQPPRSNFIPPFRSPPSSNPTPPFAPHHQQPHPVSLSNKHEPALLPPIEIPPERPLTDAEIAQLPLDSPSSFVPTTGQGLGSPRGTKPSNANIKLTLEEPIAVVPVAVQNAAENIVAAANTTTLGLKHSGVRFPETVSASNNNQPPRNCPICECTNEVDYICASNGAIYLNTCAFDCATFCEAGLKKVTLEFCALPNHV